MPNCPKNGMGGKGSPPICGKELVKEENLSFFRAIEIAIQNAIRSVACMPPAKPKYACNHMVENPKYDEWEHEYVRVNQENDLIKKENEKIRRKNKLLGIVGRAQQEKPLLPVPPRPPKLVPCKNHYKLRAAGQFNEKIIKRKKELLFDYDDITGQVSPTKTWIEKIFSPGG